MFTGIVEDLGRVKSLVKGKNSAQLSLVSPLIVSDIKLGDSIAVNGVCLTVTSFDSQSFTVDIMAETLDKTNLGALKKEDRVNLERALRLSDRLGGHLVSGHVDDLGTITGKEKQDIAIIIEVTFNPSLNKYLVPKGSVALDGTSLTIVAVDKNKFTVSLIPHTRGQTTLGFKDVGDKVNLEMDIISKYLEKLGTGDNNGTGYELGNTSKIDRSFLAERGFI